MVNSFDDEHSQVLEQEGEKSRQHQYEYHDYLQAGQEHIVVTVAETQFSRTRPYQSPQATRRERERRIDFACDVRLRFHRTSQQLAAIREEFGIGRRQAQDYLKWAKERIVVASRRPREEHLADSLDFYESIAANPFISVKERLLARKQLDRAVGIGVGAYLAIPVPVQEGQSITDLDLAAVAKQAREHRRARLMPPSPPPAEVRIAAEPERQEEAA